MATEILANAAQTLVGKAVDWMWNKLTNRSQLKFLDPEIIYCYSFYDDSGNHVHGDGRKMIYSVLCSVTLLNSSPRPQPLTQVKIAAIVAGTRYSMNLFDTQAEKWFSTHTVPADSAECVTWNAFIAGHGIMPGSPGMILINPPDAPIVFELSYCDRHGKLRRCAVRVTQVRMLSPRLIGVN